MDNNTQPAAQQPQQAPQQPTQQVQQQAPQPQQQVIVQTVESKSNGIGTAGFVLALLGLLFSWVPVVDFILWFLGFLFSFIGCFKNPKGLAITGLILSLLGIIVIIAIFGTIGALFASM